MSIGRVNFDDISEADLDDLIQAGVPEGLLIDYKRDPYGISDADKKEALKDISSFANSAGGHLIIGVEETNGVPTTLRGVRTDPDSLINRLESLARDGIEPRIVGIRMRPVALCGGGTVIVIRIPRSWNPPHRVSTARTNLGSKGLDSLLRVGRECEQHAKLLNTGLVNTARVSNIKPVDSHDFGRSGTSPPSRQWTTVHSPNSGVCLWAVDSD